MKKIALSGKNANGQFAIVDDADFGWLSQHSWFNSHGYARTGIRVNGKRTTIPMHQMIMAEAKSPMIDHIDHNPLNNQRANLRPVTNSQNMANRVSRSNKSGYKGVVFHPRPEAHRKPWHAYIQHEGKRYHSKYFATAREAAAAYNELALKHHGEYANLNEL